MSKDMPINVRSLIQQREWSSAESMLLASRDCPLIVGYSIFQRTSDIPLLCAPNAITLHGGTSFFLRG